MDKAVGSGIKKLHPGLQTGSNEYTNKHKIDLITDIKDEQTLTRTSKAH